MAEKLPLGPSTSDASVTNWDLAGKARSKCVTNVGHKVQLPPGPSTSDASATNWDLGGSLHMKNPPYGRNHREGFELWAARQRAGSINCCNR